MTRVEAVLCPSELTALSSADLTDAVCVVFDVLRATSTMVTALASGVEAVFPALDIDEARELKKLHPDALLGGERRGERIAGFDLGNSPSEYLNLRGRTVITTTTNGTVALRACERAAAVLPGAFLNRDALVATLRELTPERLLLVCAGSGAGFSLEDAIGAGAVLAKLDEGRLGLGDAALAVKVLYERYAGDLPAVLRRSGNGRALAGIGKAADIAWCARMSRYDIVPRLVDGAVHNPATAKEWAAVVPERPPKFQTE